MYLKKIKSRKRDQRTTSKIKYKRLYTMKRGGANILANNVMSDEEIHLYIGGIEMDKKDTPADFKEPVRPLPNRRGEKNPRIPRSESPQVKAKQENVKPANAEPANVKPANVTLAVSNPDNAKQANGDPANTSLLSIAKPPTNNLEFSITPFMELLNTLCTNSILLSDNATIYADKLIKKYNVYVRRSTATIPKFINNFVNHIKTLKKNIETNLDKINLLNITSISLNNINTNIFKKNKDKNLDDSSWFFFLKNILIDLLVCISESSYILELTDDTYKEILNTTTSQSYKNASRNVYNMEIVNTDEIKRNLNNKILNPLVINLPNQIFGNLRNVGFPIFIKDKQLPDDNLLEHVITYLLFQILYEYKHLNEEKQKRIQTYLEYLKQLMENINVKIQKLLSEKKLYNNEQINELNPSVITQTNSEILKFLTGIDLAKYAPTISKEGYNDIESLIDKEMLDDESLKTIIGMNPNEIKKFREAANNYKLDNIPVVKNSTNSTNPNNTPKSTILNKLNNQPNPTILNKPPNSTILNKPPNSTNSTNPNKPPISTILNKPPNSTNSTNPNKPNNQPNSNKPTISTNKNNQNTSEITTELTCAKDKDGLLCCKPKK